MRFSVSWFAFGMLLLAAGCSRTDDRFPPYDNTAEVEANWKAHPDLYQFKTAADLPKDLHWEDGKGLPELGDPTAKKGGTFHVELPTFPPTLRTFGPDGNHTFRGEEQDYVEMGLVDRHANVDKWIPGLADRWALSTDRMTVFFHLDPAATYSDGVKVTVEDFFMLFYMSLSPYLQDPYVNDYFNKEYARITKYDDSTFSITLKEPRPDPIFSANVGPYPRHFYREFTDDFPARYQWRKQPTTGPYEIYKKDVKFGRSITQTRVKNWWAKDRPYYRYRYNPDFIEYRVITSVDTAWELFRQGKIDFFSERFAAVAPVYWYDKAEIPEIQKGYIERGTFYNIYPRISRGIYLNQSKPPLDNQDVRLGINYSLDFSKVIDVVFRGDAVRMQSTFAGFGRFTDPKLRAKPYDIGKAQEYFAKAGYTKRGPDGVLVNAQGKRLSIALSTPNQATFLQAALILREGALKAGLDLNVESMDFTQLYKKGDEKQHEAIIAGWGATPPYPHAWEYYHSDNAYEKLPDGTRKPKPNTNNFTMTANPEMDKLCDAQRAAPNEDEMQRLSWLIEEKVQEEGAAIPAWDSPFYRYLSWRWLCWPKDGNLKASQLPWEKAVFWIDEDKKKETQQAMKDGKSFGEISHIYDEYREP